MFAKPSTPLMGPTGLMTDARGGGAVATWVCSCGGSGRGRCWLRGMGGGWSCSCCEGRRGC